MLQQNAQNGQQSRPSQQQPFLASSQHHSMNFDGAPPVNLDPSSMAKQMASLSAVGLARVAKVPPGPSAVNPQPPQSGGGGSYLGAMPINGHTAGHDNTSVNPFGVSPTFPNFQNPNTAAMTQQQQSSNQSNLSMGDSNMAGSNRQQPAAATLKQRQRNFLNGLTSVMSARGTPLPPTLTGVPNSQYDPNTSPWKALEPSPTEVGAFRLAGKDVDLFRLWGLVFQAGGHAKLTQQNAWGQLLSQFDLPEHAHIPQSNGQQSMQLVARVLQHYYQVILGNFEELYRKNVVEQQRKALLMRAGGAPQAPGSGIGSGSQQASANGSSQPGQQDTAGPAANIMGMMGQALSNAQSSGVSANGAATFPLQPPTQGDHQRQPSVPPMSGTTSNIDGTSSQITISGYPAQASATAASEAEQDGLSNKRKLEPEEPDSKRVRQKTESEPPESSSTAVAPSSDRISAPPNENSAAAGPSTTQIPPLPASLPTQPKRQLSRRKIEYYPLERELETHGGRDLRALEDDWSQRKPLRDVNEWGRVDIEAVTMSLRSRISIEVSYALTTLTLISTMKGQTPGTGFPISQCEDLMEELLDLLEEEAFDGAGDTFESSATEDPHTITHREIISTIHEEELRPFTSFEHRQGAKDRKQGPKPRPGHAILVIMNVLRNLTMFTDNHVFMATHERFLSLFLRVSSVVRSDDGHSPRPTSTALSLSDVVIARRDTLYSILNLAHMIRLSPTPVASKSDLRITSRVFALIASYLVDPTDAVSPVSYVKQVGVPHNGPIKPPSLPDVALQVFTLLGHPDSNRQIFPQAVSQLRIWNLFQALIHRLPIADLDFQLMAQDLWLGYLEKIIMAIYALAFLAPPSLKRKIKADRTLGFGRVMLRMVHKFLMSGSQGRTVFMVSAKRAVEAMKVIDDGKDSFDTSQSTAPTLAFGMGWSEAGDNGPEKGTGLLGGHLDVTWDLLMQREVDEMMFSELESLARVE